MSRREPNPCRIDGGNAHVCLRITDQRDRRSPDIILRSPLRASDINNALAVAEQVASHTGIGVFISAAQPGCSWSSKFIPSRAIMYAEPKAFDYADSYLVEVKPILHQSIYYASGATADYRFSFNELVEWAAEFIGANVATPKDDRLPDPAPPVEIVQELPF